MWVIKLGGSLGDAPVLQEWLNALALHGPGRTVVVPGGGAFAEQVRSAQRRWRFDDVTAHRMAVLAIQQMALMFHGLNNDLCIAGGLADINAILMSGKVALWSPDCSALDAAGVEANWTVTSDSLAAWLAGELRAAGLILVKSAAIPENADFAELAAQGITDKAFPAFAEGLNCPVKLIQRDALPVFMDMLKAVA